MVWSLRDERVVAVDPSPTDLAIVFAAPTESQS
jgi:hypothetical protein